MKITEKRGTCWVGYQQIGMKEKDGKMVPNCVKEVVDIYWENELGESCGYTFEFPEDEQPMSEAEYQGKKVKLNDPIRGGSKKFYVYVKDGDKVKKVSFGDTTGLSIKRDDPARRKSFRARHNCDNPGPKTKARYWSCYQWRANAPVDN